MANKMKWGIHRSQPALLAGVAGIAAVFGVAGALVVLGHDREASPAPIITNTSSATDPAFANLASSSTAGVPFDGYRTGNEAPRVRVLPVSAAFTPQQTAEHYPVGQQTPAPIVRGNNARGNESLQYNTQPPVSDTGTTGGDPGAYDANAPETANDPSYTESTAQEDAGYDALEQADQAPPPLPEYEQPPAPDDNFLWTPGYWSYSSGYYWVPGAWVAPPFYGALWTPPWWGWYRGHYYFHRGYWGRHIGYYGGINYGFGYIGSGFYGGYWQGRNFFYNRAVTNVNLVRVRNVYERPVVINNNVYVARGPANRISFNGPGGVQARPRPYEMSALREAHYAPVPAQVQEHRLAASDRAQFFVQNHGRPAQPVQGRPLSTPNAIADSPQRSPFNQGREFGRQPGPQGGLNQQPGGASPELNRPGNGNGAPTAPRNEMVQQRNGLWGGGNRDRNPGTGQQPPAPLQEQQRVPVQAGRLAPDGDRNLQWQQQRDAAEQVRNQQQQQQQQQRNLQWQQQRDATEQVRNQQQQQQQQRNLQWQQQRDAEQTQRNVQQQQQQRNLQWQQQRDAAEQVRNQQQIQQQQQRFALEQQRNAQLQQQQQQRMAEQQQRNMQMQQMQQQQQQRNMQMQQQQQQRPQMMPQHIDARPSPQASHGPQQFSGMHGRPQ